ncbi:hypothetical protein V2L60_14605, partial [Staphylococcus gallinarum]
MGRDQIELRNVSDLKNRIVEVTGGLITFDGDLCAGKTTLARKIGEALGLPALDLDTYLTREQDVFVNALRITDLTRAVDEALASSTAVLLSGICMLRALKVAKLDAALSIYVRRLSPMKFTSDLHTTDAEYGTPFD